MLFPPSPAFKTSSSFNPRCLLTRISDFASLAAQIRPVRPEDCSVSRPDKADSALSASERIIEVFKMDDCPLLDRQQEIILLAFAHSLTNFTPRLACS